MDDLIYAYGYRDGAFDLAGRVLELHNSGATVETIAKLAEHIIQETEKELEKEYDDD